MTDSDGETLERRLAAVERAVTEGDGGQEPSPAEGADGQVADRLDALEARVDELDAALQAVRGFLGGVDAVNERVESRADTAVAAVERLEQQLDEPDGGAESPLRGSGEVGATTASSEAEPTAEPAERTLGERLRERW